MFQGLVVALDHHHVVVCELQCARQPVVRGREQTARNVALRKFEFAVDDVAAEHVVHHHLTALERIEAAEIPELSLQERQRRHRVVACGDGHHIAGATIVAKGRLRDNQHGGVGVEMHPHALLEHKGVGANIIRAEVAFPSHRARHHGIRAALRRLEDPAKLMFHGRLHSSSSSSS